jgi:hypothetical protein
MSATEDTSRTARAMLTARRFRSSSTTRPSAAPPAAQTDDDPATTTMRVPVSRRTPMGRGSVGGRNVPTDAIAKIHAFGLTHWCFSRRFGIAPHRYLLARRIDAARGRLLDGEPIAQVATGVGFHNQAHLTRHFKRHVGTTPGRYASPDMPVDPE